MSPSASLYDDVGAARLRLIIEDFYHRAFLDPIIGHFFFGKQHKALVEGQIQFTARMLGHNEPYKGRGLREVHASLDIRKPHFMRRQVLLQESMQRFQLDQKTQQAWLDLEQRFIPILVKNPGHPSMP